MNNSLREAEECLLAIPSCTVEKEENPDAWNKSHPTWKNLYNTVKHVLAKREHVSRNG